jgi:hypothetical protein
MESINHPVDSEMNAESRSKAKHALQNSLLEHRFQSILYLSETYIDFHATLGANGGRSIPEQAAPAFGA